MVVWTIIGVFFIVLLVSGMAVLLYIFVDSFIEERFGYVFSALMGILLLCLCLSLAIQRYRCMSTDDYYLPCEIVATNVTTTYFGTVDSDEQRIYAVPTEDHVWFDNVPYLLYMDSNGTSDTDDDVVMSVWIGD